MSLVPYFTFVQRATTLRRERMLPAAGEILVREGQVVTPVQVIARTTYERGYLVLRASEALNVPPEDVPTYLAVEVGAAVQRGTTLLHKAAPLGMGRRLASPVAGTLVLVRRGRLVIQYTPELFDLRAMMPGRVVRLIGERGVVLETAGARLEAVWASGKDGYGQIKMATATPSAALTAEQISTEMRGAIVVAGTVKDGGVLRRAGENGARGLVAGSVAATLLPAVAAINLPVVVTDGFGERPMATPFFQLLQEAEGREATLFGKMDGHNRPEIIIAAPAMGDGAPGSTDMTRRPTALRLGQRVRILRPPHAAAVGLVKALYPGGRDLPNGLRLPGADVALPDGSVTFVPYANLDVIL